MLEGIDPLGGVMRKADNSKTTKLNHKKESFLKTKKSVSSSIMEPEEITPDETKMEMVAVLPDASEVTPEERHHLISEAAYYHAERRSFIPGYELDDWLNAEAEIERMLAKPGVENLIL